MASLKLSQAVGKLVPRNAKQQRYVDILQKDKPSIVIASGSPGSGKTLFAAFVGAEKLCNGEVDKMVVTRPTVVAGPDDLGFLPGDIQQKMEPWMMPIYDSLKYHYTRPKIDQLVRDKIIEITPIGFLRGRTFERSWMICDEAQNMTVGQVLTVLTRIGRKSKLILTGDPMQHDRGFEVNGLSDLVSRIQAGDTNGHFEYIEFNEGDVERHPAIPVILNLYKSP